MSNLNESIATTNHNSTTIDEKCKRNRRPDSNVSFPRIKISREKFTKDKNRLEILKSQRGQKEKILKLEQSKTNESILLLNNLQVQVCSYILF